jgi:tetratricopeptide (TPR) repeat protein
MTRRPWIVAALVAATLIAYLPALSAGFVWDDNDWVTEHPVVTGERGWSEIWTGQTRFQFYPVLFSAWRVQYALWGLDPAGYHAVNILLHAATAVLLGLFFTRLDLRGAWWIAAAFALHPLHVESVAWITELKNVLSGALVVASALLFLAATEGKSVARGRYALALLLFVAAMLAKTAVAVAAVLLPIVLYLKRDRFETRDLILAAPFVAVGGVLGWIAVRLEQGMAAAMIADFAFSGLDRVLIGTHALFFYPLKLIVPAPLIFNYPRWDLAAWQAWVWPLAAVAALAAAVLFWRRGHRGPVCALAAYGVLVAPALGIFDVYAFRYSFVADHFVYLASIPLIALVVEMLTRRIPGRRRQRLTIGIGLILVLGVLTWNQTHAYKDRTSLWTHTLARNPDSWLAHHSIALEALNQGRTGVAAIHFEEAIRCKPEAAESWTGRAQLHLEQGNAGDAMADLDRALELAPAYPQARLERGQLSVELGRYEEAIADLDLFLAANPGVVDALVSRAEANARLDRVDDALADLDAAVRAGGSSELVAVGHELQGAALVTRGRIEEGCAELRRACDRGRCAAWQAACAEETTTP